MLASRSVKKRSIVNCELTTSSNASRLRANTTVVSYIENRVSISVTQEGLKVPLQFIG